MYVKKEITITEMSALWKFGALYNTQPNSIHHFNLSFLHILYTTHVTHVNLYFMFEYEVENA